MVDAPAPGDPVPAPLVFIHDAAIDDFVATLLIEAMPQFDLKAVVIANADCLPESGIDVASRVNQFIGRPDLPLGLSRARGWNPFPWAYRSDCVRLSKMIPSLAKLTSNTPTSPPSGDDLLTGLLETAVATGRPLTVLLTTGFTPLTSVLAARPALAAGIARVAWMGGALDAPGNLDPKTTDPSVANTHAEWNVFWDPFAADQGLATLPEVAVFPLDITNSAKISIDFVARLKAQASQHSFSEFAYQAYGLVSNEPFYDMWDVTSAVWLGAPQVFAPPRRTALQVTPWGFEQGWMQAAAADSHRPKHDVYLSFADQPGFYDYVLAGLARSA